MEIEGWSTAAFDGSKWPAAVHVDEFKGKEKVAWQPMNPIRQIELNPPLSITPIKIRNTFGADETVYVFKFPQNAAGWSPELPRPLGQHLHVQGRRDGGLRAALHVRRAPLRRGARIPCDADRGEPDAAGRARRAAHSLPRNPEPGTWNLRFAKREGQEILERFARRIGCGPDDHPREGLTNRAVWWSLKRPRGFPKDVPYTAPRDPQRHSLHSSEGPPKTFPTQLRGIPKDISYTQLRAGPADGGAAPRKLSGAIAFGDAGAAPGVDGPRCYEHVLWIRWR
eukprot:gene17528-biopygen2562